MTVRQRCTGTTHRDQRCQHRPIEGTDRCGKHPHDDAPACPDCIFCDDTDREVTQ